MAPATESFEFDITEARQRRAVARRRHILARREERARSRAGDEVARPAMRPAPQSDCARPHRVARAMARTLCARGSLEVGTDMPAIVPARGPGLGGPRRRKASVAPTLKLPANYASQSFADAFDAGYPLEAADEGCRPQLDETASACDNGHADMVLERPTHWPAMHTSAERQLTHHSRAAERANAGVPHREAGQDADVSTPHEDDRGGLPMADAVIAAAVARTAALAESRLNEIAEEVAAAQSRAEAQSAALKAQAERESVESIAKAETLCEEAMAEAERMRFRARVEAGVIKGRAEQEARELRAAVDVERRAAEAELEKIRAETRAVSEAEARAAAEKERRVKVAAAADAAAARKAVQQAERARSKAFRRQAERERRERQDFERELTARRRQAEAEAAVVHARALEVAASVVHRARAQAESIKAEAEKSCQAAGELAQRPIPQGAKESSEEAPMKQDAAKEGPCEEQDDSLAAAATVRSLDLAVKIAALAERTRGEEDWELVPHDASSPELSADEWSVLTDEGEIEVQKAV